MTGSLGLARMRPTNDVLDGAYAVGQESNSSPAAALPGSAIEGGQKPLADLDEAAAAVGRVAVVRTRSCTGRHHQFVAFAIGDVLELRIGHEPSGPDSLTGLIE